MPREFTRIERVADAIKRELAVLIRESVRDPRVGMVNVNDVELSRDLTHCRVYVGFVDDRTEIRRQEGINTLNEAAGYLRRLLAASIKLRVIPKISFFYDNTGTKGMELESLINEALEKDQLIKLKKES